MRRAATIVTPTPTPAPAPTPPTLSKRAEELAAELGKFLALVAAAPGEEPDPELARILGPNLCRVAKMLIPSTTLRSF